MGTLAIYFYDMRKLAVRPPFKIEISNLVKQMRDLPVAVNAKIKISVPFFEVTVEPDDRERKIARELVIRLSDRRVLNTHECCDGCIDQAIASLKEVRGILVDKQVEFSDKADTALYILTDSIREAIRQFLTFEQRLEGKHKLGERNHKEQEIYYAALEMLRAHIHRTLIQIAKIADFQIPEIPDYMRYEEAWQLNVYETPKLGKG